MTNELVKILEKALELEKKSMLWFDRYEKTDDESDWNMSQKFNERASGMLLAYEILTGKKVICMICDIRKELESL